MATLHVRVDDDVKKRVQQILKALGLDMSTAVNIYLYQIMLQRGIPFDVSQDRYIPHHIMEQWEQETQEALQTTKGYRSAEELHADILDEDHDG